MAFFWTVRVIAAVAAVIFVHLIAAWIGSSLRINAAMSAPANGLAIYVETNGIHTGLIVPLVNEHADFSAYVSADHARASPAGATHMLVGWGHAGVYRDTPRWQNLRPGDALSAAFGSDDTLLHVTFTTEPTPNRWQRRVMVSPAAYREIARRIAAGFVQGAAHSPAYADNDVFYDSHGRYSALFTCNEWTGSILRDAGVPMGRWTPFAGGVTKWLPVGVN